MRAYNRFPYFEKRDGIVAINEEAAESVLGENNEATLIDASAIFLAQRHRPQTPTTEDLCLKEDANDYEVAEIYAHLLGYVYALGETNAQLLLNMPEQSRAQLFREAHGEHMERARRKITERAIDTVNGYIQWVEESASIRDIENGLGLHPGSIRRLANKMPSYVAETWPFIMPGRRLGKVAVDGNVIYGDFRVSGGEDLPSLAAVVELKPVHSV